MITRAVIQARMRSSRLPGKVLLQLCGSSVLSHVIRRVGSSGVVDEVLVATSDLAVDDAVADEASDAGASIFRGSELDVLSRYHSASNGADVIVRITSDCPLLDPNVLKRMVEAFRGAQEAGERLDYMSNSLQRTFPRGLDAEVFTASALAQAHAEARKDYEREHVTPYIYTHPDRFRIRAFLHAEDHSSHRWTLDTPEDLELIRRVYDALHPSNPLFGMEEVLELLRLRPELSRINEHVQQKHLTG